MAILSKGKDFDTGEQVTATKLDNLVDNAIFASGAVDNVTTQINGSGQLIVKDSGVSTVKIADDAVTTAKILNSNVTKAKIENLADYKVLGNVSGGAAAPSEVAILDEDNMASDSATSLATQQSIKAYVDAPKDKCLVGITTNLSATIPSGSFYTVPFDREISDVANMHDNVTNNSRVTIGTDGLYLITATIGTNETDNGNICISIAKNNSEVVRVKFNTGSTDDGQSINISHMDSLSAGDYIEARLVNISGNSTTINTKTFLSVAELA